MFSHQSEDASVAQDHAKSITKKKQFSEEMLAQLYELAKNDEGGGEGEA